MASANGGSLGSILTGAAIGFITSGVPLTGFEGLAGSVSTALGSFSNEAGRALISGTLVGGMAAKAQGGKFIDGVKGAAIGMGISVAVRGVMSIGENKAGNGSSNSLAEGSMTRAEYEADLARRGVQESSLSVDQQSEINGVLGSSEFKGEADAIWSASVACKCESSALRVYEIEGQGYLMQRIGDATGGLRLTNLPDTVPYSSWRHVVDWHPHIRGTALPSGPDLSTSLNQGTASAVRYSSGGRTRLYRGEAR